MGIAIRIVPALAARFPGRGLGTGARKWGKTSDEHRNFVYLTLGLLGFALVACLVRTGGYALRLEPALYAVPLMVVALAAVHAARRLAPDEPDARRLALLRFGGYVLSGLAFALDFSQPPASSAVFSANTLAVSILGLALYASSLSIERHPAFLYMAIGAIVAGRVGAQYFPGRAAARDRRGSPTICSVIRISCRYRSARSSASFPTRPSRFCRSGS